MTASTPKPGFLARLKHHILHPELSPEQVAWSFALGLSIAFNPLLGLHTVMVLTFCVIFRGLHRPMMLIAAFANNPWTLVPIATASVGVGNALRGRGWNLDTSAIRWREIGIKSFVSWEGFQNMLTMLSPVLRSYLIGGLALCLVALPLGYFLMLWISRRMRARVQALAAEEPAC